MDYEQINKNSLRIVEVLSEGKNYFNQIHEKSKIKSKNNLLKNLNLLQLSNILIKEENKSNTFYSINYSNNVAIALLNLINKTKFEKLPFGIKKSIIESVYALSPKIGILFGSHAKENYKKESDIDLLFIEGETSKTKIREISKKHGVQINIIFMKSEELNLKSESLMHIFKTGYPITGEEYFYNELKKEI